MSNHFSADYLKSPGDDRRLDITDVFVFRSSKDPDKMMLIVNSNPTAPAPVPDRDPEFYPGAVYRINIDTDGDAHADAAFTFTFSEYQDCRQTGTAWHATGEAARQPEPAGEVLAEGIPVNFDGALGPHYNDAGIRHCRSWMRLARGDTEAALTDQRESLISARQAKDPQVLFCALARSAYLLALAGRTDEAQPILSELFGISEADAGGLDESGTDCVLAAEILGRRGEAQRWLSTWRHTPWSAAARQLADQEFVAPAESLDSIGPARSAALAPLRAAQGLARTGRQAAADDQLRHALRFFPVRRCHALHPPSRRTAGRSGVTTHAPGRHTPIHSDLSPQVHQVIAGVAAVMAGLYSAGMPTWAREIDALAERSGFAGVVAVDRGGQTEFAKAYGLADRAHQVRNTIDTRFGLASGTKGLTALAVVSLISDGALSLSTAARSVLGADLPLIGDDVTVEHLLAHRSGIGDYLDEQDGHEVTDYVLTVPAQELASTEAYLAVLGGHPAKFGAGERFCYCDSGYVVLALIAERVSGIPFPQLVQDRVCRPAGMRDTGFVRSDELPGRAAIGYLPVEGSWRTNVFHLPVVGSGDGGIYSTAADISALWRSLFANQIVPNRWVAQMMRPRSDVPAQQRRYGLGFWLGRHTSTMILEGFDAGVSFRSVHDPASTVTRTVISNSSYGTWPITSRLDDLAAS